MSAVDGFLATVVTEVLLTALARLRAEGKPEPLFIGSPWLSDFPLFPGVFAGSFPYLLPDTEPQEVATIASFVRTWRSYGGSVTIVVQSYDRNDWPRKDSAARNREELELLESCLRAGAEVLFAKAFHSKFIVIPEVVVSGSANLTYYGFYKNVEHVHVHRKAISAVDYESERLVCMNHIATARGLGTCRPPSSWTGCLLPPNVPAIRTALG